MRILSRDARRREGLHSFTKAFRYSLLLRTVASGMTRGSGMISSISACRRCMTSRRRLSSQNMYDSVVDEVSTPATLRGTVS